MIVELSLYDRRDILRAVSGYSAKDAYSRLTAFVAGTTKLKFEFGEIVDEGTVFGNVVEILAFLNDLAVALECSLTIRYESRAYARSAKGGFDIFNSDSDKYLDHVSTEEIAQLIEYIQGFLKSEVGSVSGETYRYFLSHTRLS